jgi:single-strand DNA-binding protein
MANLNKVMLIGRLTRDPEIRTFPTGGKIARFGFAVNNSRKNASTGQWEDDPVFLDIEASNRMQGRQLADLVEQHLHKGNQVYLEGHLKLDQWTSQDGQKRSKIKIILDNLQFLEARAGGEGGGRYQRPGSAPVSGAPVGGDFDEPPPEPDTYAPPAQGTEEDIPF